MNKFDYITALSHFEESAQTGNEYGQLFAGLLHAIGLGDTEQNRVKSFVYFQQAATQWNNPVAQYAMGMQYLTGLGIQQNTQFGLNALTIAAESGWTEAKVQLAHEYHYGRHGVPLDPNMAIYWYTRVIKQDINCRRDALFLFGNNDIRIDFESDEDKVQIAQPKRSMYRESPLQIHDERDPFSYLFYWDTMCDDPSVALTQSHVGIGLVDLETATDYKTCLENWKLALKGASPIASYYLGVLYKRGLGAPIDYVAAMTFFKQAYKWGYDLALFEVGRLYYKGGYGLYPDAELAFRTFTEYYEIKGEESNAKMFYYLGQIREEGCQGVLRDFSKAMLFYKKGYQMGHGKCAYAIGLMYNGGRGVQPDVNKEHEWYSKAGALGYSKGYQTLGQLYLDGYVQGIEGLQLALKHFKTAFEMGCETAGAMMVYVNNRLQQSQMISFY